MSIGFNDFLKLDIRVGTITDAEKFPKARRASYKIWVNFGKEIGIRKSSAQITKHYTPDTLIGKQILGVINLSPKQIGPFMSEFLTLGLMDEKNEVVLISPDKPVPNGHKLM